MGKCEKIFKKFENVKKVKIKIAKMRIEKYSSSVKFCSFEQIKECSAYFPIPIVLNLVQREPIAKLQSLRIDDILCHPSVEQYMQSNHYYLR